MEDSHFCSESCYCPMKLDMENANDKLAFLEENWPDLDRLEQINDMSMKNLKCSLCMVEIIVHALAREELYCPNRKIIRLVNTMTIIQNTIEIRNIEEELQQCMERNITDKK